MNKTPDSTNTRQAEGGTFTCFLVAEAGHHLRSPFCIGFSRGISGQLHHHAHPLQGGGEGEATEDPDWHLVLLGREWKVLTGLGRLKRATGDIHLWWWHSRPHPVSGTSPLPG